MNMLDGLKVAFDELGDGDRQYGVIVQTQLVDKKFLYAIMDRDGYIYVVKSRLVFFSKVNKDRIFNKPMEVISKIAQAERADSIKHRFQILDLRE